MSIITLFITVSFPVPGIIHGVLHHGLREPLEKAFEERSKDLRWISLPSLMILFLRCPHCPIKKAASSRRTPNCKSVYFSVTSIRNSVRLGKHCSNADYLIEDEKDKYEEVIFLADDVECN